MSNPYNAPFPSVGGNHSSTTDCGAKGASGKAKTRYMTPPDVKRNQTASGGMKRKADDKITKSFT